jgi:hypothetical protein
MWSIVQLEHKVQDGLVITAHWQLVETQDGQTARVYGSIGLPAKEPTDPTFIPFDELTEEVVIDWVKAQMGEERVAELEANIAAQLDALLNPTTTTGLPWGNA